MGVRAAGHLKRMADMREYARVSYLKKLSEHKKVKPKGPKWQRRWGTGGATGGNSAADENDAVLAPARHGFFV